MIVSCREYLKSEFWVMMHVELHFWFFWSLSDGSNSFSTNTKAISMTFEILSFFSVIWAAKIRLLWRKNEFFGLHILQIKDLDLYLMRFGIFKTIDHSAIFCNRLQAFS